MPDPKDDTSLLALATRYSDGAAEPAYDPNAPPEYRGQFLNHALPENPHGWGPAGPSSPEQPYRGPFANARDPGWRDAVADFLRSAIGERSKMMSPEGERLVTGITGATGAGGRGSSVADFVPGLGLATASMDSAQALHNGNYPIATLSALSALVPGAIGKVIKNAGRGAVHAITDPVRELFGNPRAGMTQTGPVQARAVHGAPVGYDAFKLDRGTPHEDYWASDAPATANTYTHTDRAADPAYDRSNFHPNLTPVDLNFKNALIVNKGGGRHTYHGVPYETKFNGIDRGSTDYLAAYAKAQGHDGLVVHNVQDGLSYYDKAPYATTYAALQPGTVKSALSGAQIFGLAPVAAGAADMASQDRPSGFADGGTPTYPGDDPDFLSMLANNPHGWGNSPPIPVSIQDKEPWNFPGEARNLADRPSDPIETPLAESLSPTMGAYGAGQTLGESLNRFASGDLKGSAETALPLLLGIFAGPGARTADLGMLAKAKELASAKAPREQIWNDTGWFQGKDQGWRHEISDDKARYAASGYRGGHSSDKMLPDVLGHPNLYEAYPGMRDIQTVWDTGPRAGAAVDASGERAAYVPDIYGRQAIVAMGGTKDDLISSYLHEAQHAVARQEGFAPGEDFTRLRADRLAAMQELESHVIRLEDIQERTADAIRRGDFGTAATLKQEAAALSQRANQLFPIARQDHVEAYKNSAGEVEARNVQARQSMTPEQRRATPPWETQDVPDDQQIVRSPSSSGVQMSMKPKIPPYPGDLPVNTGVEKSVSGNPLAASGSDRLSLPSNTVETGSAEPSVMKLSDGTHVYNDGRVTAELAPSRDGATVLSFSSHSPGAGNARAALQQIKKMYGSVDAQEIGYGPGTGAFDFWKKMHDEGILRSATNDDLHYILDPRNSPSPQSGSGEGTTLGGAGRLPDSNPPYPGDVPMQGSSEQIRNSSVSGTTQEQVDPSRLLRSHDVEAGSGLRVVESSGDGGVKRYNFFDGDMLVGNARMMGDTLGDIEVNPELRRQGYGEQIVREMMSRGAKNWNAVTPESQSLFGKVKP